MNFFYTIFNKKFLDKHIHLLLGILFCIISFITLFITKDINIIMYILFIAFACFTAKKELKNNVKTSSFIYISIPFILILIFLQKYGYDIWGKILSWQITKNIGLDLNPIFKDIPYNDASFARIYKPDFLTYFFRFVYNNGFVVPAVIPIYRAFLCKDLKKMFHYALSAHIFQIFLISPFYAAIHLQEVWFVLGHPDGLDRHFTYAQAAGWTLNCFPSMHTSIAFAMFLVVLREKDKVFKFLWGFFCLSVIYSTMYLEIHWVLDVLGGLILAYITVKLSDLVLNLSERFIPKSIKDFYYKSPV